MSLTDRQKEILSFIKDHLSAFGFPPTIREIGAEFKIGSTNGVVDHLKALEKKGCIARHRQRSRALEILI